jgi:hypothetical protein
MTFIKKIKARIVDELTGKLGITDIAKQLDSLLPEDRDYALKHLPNHMAKAARCEQLHRWLTDFNFIEVKVSALGAQPLIDDYNLGSNFDLRLSGEQAKTLILIQGAIRLSAHVLRRDKTQLAGQLLGRLQGTSPIRPEKGGARGKSRHSGNAGESKTVERGTLAAPPDAQPDTPRGCAPASYNNTLKIWDLNSGEEMAIFTGDGWLYCCAVSPDGVTVVAGDALGRVHFLRLEGAR